MVTMTTNPPAKHPVQTHVRLVGSDAKAINENGWTDPWNLEADCGDAEHDGQLIKFRLQSGSGASSQSLTHGETGNHVKVTPHCEHCTPNQGQ